MPQRNQRSPSTAGARPSNAGSGANTNTHTKTDKGKSPALNKSRPDQRTQAEGDSRGAADKDGNEGHAKELGVKGKPAR